MFETTDVVPLLEPHQADPLAQTASDGRWFIPRFAFSRTLAEMLMTIGYAEADLVQAGMKALEEALPELSKILAMIDGMPFFVSAVGFTTFAEIEVMLPDWLIIPVVVATTVESQDEFSVYTLSALLYPSEKQDYAQQSRSGGVNLPRIDGKVRLIVPFKAGARRTED